MYMCCFDPKLVADMACPWQQLLIYLTGPDGSITKAEDRLLAHWHTYCGIPLLNRTFGDVASCSPELAEDLGYAEGMSMFSGG